MILTKNTIRKTHGFTLIELIVVITILTILSSIGFVTMTGYFAGARDGARLADINSIYSQLTITHANNGVYVMPDDYKIITLSGTIFSYQGYAGKTVLSTIKFNGGGRDPKDNIYYTYVTNKKQSQAQLMGYFEEYDTTKLSNITKLVPEVSAEGLIDYSDRNIGLIGKKIGVVVNSGTLVPVQDDTSTGILDIANTSTEHVIYFDSSINNGHVGGTGSILQNAIAEKSVAYVAPNSCATDPVLAHSGVLTIGTPMSVAQAWAYNTTPGNCTYSCSTGYIGSDCSISNSPFVRTMGGWASSTVWAVSVDSSGSIYVVGSYTNTMSNTSSIMDFSQKTLSGMSTTSSSDGYIAKLNSLGVQMWIKTIGGSGAELVRSVAIDSNNNVYVAGHYTNNSTNSNMAKDFAGNSFSGVSGVNGFDGFVAKLSGNDGTQTWIKTMGGDSSDFGRSVTIDSSNNVYVGGNYTNDTGGIEGTKDFSGAPLLGVSAGSFTDAFIAKLSGNDGTQTWIKTMGGSAADTMTSIVSDSSNNIYVGGNYTNGSGAINGTKDFSGAPLLGTSGTDGYIAKLSGSNGAQTWIKTMGGYGNDGVFNISVDSSGSIYTAGYYTDNIIGGNGTKDFSGSQLLGMYSIAMFDGFVAKLSGNDGTQTWIKTLGGNGDDVASSVSVDSNGSVYIAGYYKNNNTDGNETKDFSGSQLLGASTASLSDGYIAKLSTSNGSQTWMKIMGGTKADAASSVFVDTHNTIHVAGTHVEVGTAYGTKDFLGNHLYGNSATATTIFLQRL